VLGLPRDFDGNSLLQISKAKGKSLGGVSQYFKSGDELIERLKQELRPYIQEDYFDDYFKRLEPYKQVLRRFANSPILGINTMLKEMQRGPHDFLRSFEMQSILRKSIFRNRLNSALKIFEDAPIQLRNLKELFLYDPFLFARVLMLLGERAEELLAYVEENGELNLSRYLEDENIFIRFATDEVSALKASRNIINAFNISPHRVLATEAYSHGRVDLEVAQKYLPLSAYRRDWRYWVRSEGGRIVFVQFTDKLGLGQDPDGVSLPYSPFKYLPIEKASTKTVNELRKKMNLTDRKILIAASPNAEEQSFILEIYRKMDPEERPILVLASRGDVFFGLTEQLENAGIDYLIRDHREEKWDEIGKHDVVIVTTQGELIDFIKVSDVAIVGSDRDTFEPATQELPILYFDGISSNNWFMTNLLTERDAAFKISSNPDEFREQIESMLQNPDAYTMKTRDAVSDFEENILPTGMLFAKLLIAGIAMNVLDDIADALGASLGEEDIGRLKNMSYYDWQDALAERAHKPFEIGPAESVKEVVLKLMAIRQAAGWSEDGIYDWPITLIDYIAFLKEHTSKGDTLLITGMGGDLEIGWAALMLGLDVVFTDVKGWDEASERTRKWLKYLGLPSTYKVKAKKADIRTLKTDVQMDGFKVLTMINLPDLLFGKDAVDYIASEVLPIISDEAFIVMSPAEAEAVESAIGSSYTLEEIEGYVYPSNVYVIKFYKITRIKPIQIEGASLGQEEAYREVSDTLTNLEEPVDIFISHEDYRGFSLGQRKEIMGLASLNEDTLTVTIYNVPKELVGNLLSNMRLISGGINEAVKGLKHLKNNLSFSKTNPFVKEDFKDFPETVHFFKFTTDEAGTAAVGLLYSQSDNKVLFRQKYDLKEENGFFTTFSQFLNDLVQRFGASLVIEVAA